MSRASSSSSAGAGQQGRLGWLAAAILIVALAAGFALAPARSSPAQAAGGPPDTTVAAWGDALERAFSAAGQSPAEGMTYVGLVHYAIYDAVVTVKGGYVPLFYRGPQQPNASVEAAVAAAGRGMLVKLLPAQSAIAEELYASQLAAVPNGAAKTAGINVGESTSAAVLALPIVKQIAPGLPYTPASTARGAWEPTSPPPAAVIGLWLTKATPVFLGSRAQFRPGSSLPLTSAGYTDDFNEVRAIGSKTSATRTQAQTDQAMFWAEPPVQQALRSLRGFAKERSLDIVDSARLMAMAGGVYQEGMLACMDAKYATPAWRPVTAIRRADLDGNDGTTKDEAWEPLLGTPNHPEHPSAHSCVSVGIGTIVERFMGGAPFSYTMVSVASRPNRTFTSSVEFANDVAEARIYGGIHFRQATIDGSLVSRQIADHLISNHFKTGGPATSAPLPPNTGDSVAAESDRSAFLAVGTAVIVVAVALGLSYRRNAARR